MHQQFLQSTNYQLYQHQYILCNAHGVSNAVKPHLCLHYFRRQPQVELCQLFFIPIPICCDTVNLDLEFQILVLLVSIFSIRSMCQFHTLAYILYFIQKYHFVFYFFLKRPILLPRQPLSYYNSMNNSFACTTMFKILNCIYQRIMYTIVFFKRMIINKPYKCMCVECFGQNE